MVSIGDLDHTNFGFLGSMQPDCLHRRFPDSSFCFVSKSLSQILHTYNSLKNGLVDELKIAKIIKDILTTMVDLESVVL